MPSDTILTLLAAAAAAAAPQPQATPYPGTPSAPISRAALPAFPHLRWPASVVPKGAPVEQPVGHFRFWDGSVLQDVEGRTLLVTLVAAKGATFDAPALRAAMARQLTRIGGARIARGPVPAALLDTINDADRKALAPGLGDLRHDPAQTWVIRRADRTIWVQYSDNDRQASLAVVSAKGK